MKIPDRASLEKRRGIIIADLLAKVEADDMHGVADCAMDCREIDAQLKLLALLDKTTVEHVYRWCPICQIERRCGFDPVVDRWVGQCGHQWDNKTSGWVDDARLTATTDGVA